jgi:hypothetical protein
MAVGMQKLNKQVLNGGKGEAWKNAWMGKVDAAFEMLSDDHPDKDIVALAVAGDGNAKIP